jgi:alpha-L-arabinofuranosidase
MVRIGCLAQLVNVIAPIMTEPGGGAWRQASSTRSLSLPGTGGGMVLQLPLQSPAYETGAFGDVPVLDAVAVASDEGGVTLFAVNRDQATPVALEVDVRSLPSLSAASHVAKLDGGRLQAVLPSLSWNMIRLCWQRPSRAGGACRFNRCRRRLGAGTQEGWPKSRCPAATPPGLC